MSFSANRCAYCPSPSFSSQSATCCIAAGPLLSAFVGPRGQVYPTNPQCSRQDILREQPPLANGAVKHPTAAQPQAGLKSLKAGG
jgi:hypothetical protein